MKEKSPDLTRRDALKSIGASGGLLGIGTGAVGTVQATRHLRLNIYADGSALSSASSTIAPTASDGSNLTVDHAQTVADAFEEYFETFDRWSTVTAVNYVGDEDFTFDVDYGDVNHVTDLESYVPAWRDRDGFNLVYVRDASLKLGSERTIGGDDVTEARGIGYVNTKVGPSFPSVNVPGGYLDVMAMHEIFHGFSNQNDCPDDHSMGDPNVNCYTPDFPFTDRCIARAKPSIMASGYVFQPRSGDCGTPSSSCNDGGWDRLTGWTEPQLEVTSCMDEVIRETVQEGNFYGSGDSHDFSHHR